MRHGQTSGIRLRRREWLAAASIIVACSDAPTQHEPPPPGGGQISLLGAAVDPLVAVTSESARLLLTVEGAEADDIRLELSNGTSLLQAGTAVSELTLRDDGTQGDDQPGDGVFTVDGLTVPLRGQIVGSTTIGTSTLTAAIGAATRSVLIRPRISVRVVDEGRIAIPEVTRLADRDVQFTSRVVVLVSQVDPADFADARDSIVARYYDVFPDDRDWLVVMRAPSSAEEYEGQALRIRNHITGIGMRVHNSISTFGSASRLALVVEHVRDLYWPRGEFDGAFCLLTHELTHRWAAELASPLAAHSHWTDDFLRTASGFGWNGKCRFNPLELYLAGRLPPDSVTGPLTAQGMTIADVLATHGPRSPQSSTEVYNIGFIVVADRFLADHEIAYFHYIAEEYTKAESTLGLTFEGATEGRIVLEGTLTRLDEG